MFIEISNLSKIYKSGDIEVKALNSVNLELEQGQIVVILGPSGSGKSTLLNIIGGIDYADGGFAYIDGTDITRLNSSQLTEYRRRMIGFVFQFYNLVPNLTVYENIEVVTNISDDPMDIDEIMEAVDIASMKNRFPRELSGGQQQRVSIARALVKRPKLLLCDEPTGALDYASSKDILKLVSAVNKRFNTTILIVTHNNAIANMAHRVVKLRSGEIVEARVNENIIPAERIEW